MKTTKTNVNKAVSNITKQTFSSKMKKTNNFSNYKKTKLKPIIKKKKLKKTNVEIEELKQQLLQKEQELKDREQQISIKEKELKDKESITILKEMELDGKIKNAETDKNDAIEMKNKAQQLQQQVITHFNELNAKIDNWENKLDAITDKENELKQREYSLSIEVEKLKLMKDDINRRSNQIKSITDKMDDFIKKTDNNQANDDLKDIVNSVQNFLSNDIKCIQETINNQKELNELYEFYINQTKQKQHKETNNEKTIKDQNKDIKSLQNEISDLKDAICTNYLTEDLSKDGEIRKIIGEYNNSSKAKEKIKHYIADYNNYLQDKQNISNQYETKIENLKQQAKTYINQLNHDHKQEMDRLYDENLFLRQRIENLQNKQYLSVIPEVKERDTKQEQTQTQTQTQTTLPPISKKKTDIINKIFYTKKDINNMDNNTKLLKTTSNNFKEYKTNKF